MTISAIVPHTRIDNTIIDNLASQIGIYGLGIYVAIKRHLNQRTGECYPSYKTIARKLGVDRGTVIRYVKKLTALKLLSPQIRFKEDGSPTSNQYNFQGAEISAPSGSVSKQPPVVVEDNHPSSSVPPEQSEPNNKQQTISDVVFLADKNPQIPHSDLSSSHKSPQTPISMGKQKTCPHPPTEIVFLADNVTICHHCYGLLDENLTLQGEDREPEIVAA